MQALEDGHFHFEDLFGLFGRFQFEGHQFPRHQIDPFVDLAEAASADLANLSSISAKRNKIKTTHSITSKSNRDNTVSVTRSIHNYLGEREREGGEEGEWGLLLTRPKQ